MAYDLEEQEQIEQIKAWWKKYGTATLALLTLALAIVLGWQGWNWYQNHQASQSRGYFEALQKAAGSMEGEESVVRVKAAMKTLQDDYAKTDYAARGVLMGAQALARDGDAEGARNALKWLANSDHPEFAPIARLRLAGMLLDEKSYDQALDALASPPTTFEGLYADRRGDVLMAKGEAEQAVSQWNDALERLDANSDLRSIVLLKIETAGS